MPHPDIRRRNNVQVVGHGSVPLLLAHGFGCDQAMWRRIVPAFTDDYKVVLFDHIGAGRSDLSAYSAERHASLDGYASDVLEICAALDLQDVVFVGHSVSATVGMLAAIREPARFSRLVLIGPTPCYLNDGPYQGGFERADLLGLLDMMEKNYFSWAGTLAPMIGGADNPAEDVAELQESFCATDPVIARQFAKATFLSDYRGVVPSVAVPTLIMQCASDAIAPERVGRYLAERLPTATLHLMEATGHCPHLTHPAETIAVIRRYLAEPAATWPVPMPSRAR